jgi:basic membrane protein A and related proteins
MRRNGLVLLVLLVSVLLMFGVWGCGEETPIVDEETPPVSDNGDVEGPDVRLATIMPGSVQDADYNTLGYIAVQAVQEELGIESVYSERVAVPDSRRVMQEYIDAGFNTIWVHGAQFNSYAFELAEEFPDVSFIVEVDLIPDNTFDNVWYMKRNFYVGFYVLGALAANVTETNHIGWIGGLEMAFAYGEINAIQQGLIDQGLSNATVSYMYVGDFNDPVGARQASERLIANDCDVIISSVNEGNYGLFNAVEETDKPVFITTKYTDKQTLAPDNYLTTDGFNFALPLIEAVERIAAGERGGVLDLHYGQEGEAPRYTIFPIANVSQEINDLIMQVARDVEDGTIVVNMEMTEILDLVNVEEESE